MMPAIMQEWPVASQVRLHENAADTPIPQYTVNVSVITQAHALMAEHQRVSHAAARSLFRNPGFHCQAPIPGELLAGPYRPGRRQAGRTLSGALLATGVYPHHL